MGILLEFRIALPLTVSEFHRGSLFVIARISGEETSGDEGIEWLANEPYDNTSGTAPPSRFSGTAVPTNKGQYTLKRYHFRSRLPSIVCHLVPGSALYLVEEAWNSYPLCKTVLTNGYLDNHKFRIVIESLHLDGPPVLENALALGEEDLKARVVEYIDIRSAHSDPAAKGYKAAYDVGRFRSTTTGRGPFTTPEWWASSSPPVEPLMCAYKLVRAEFHYFPLQSRVEGFVIAQQRALFNRTHAQAFCCIDEWSSLSMEDVKKIEDEVASKAKAQLQKALEGVDTVER